MANLTSKHAFKYPKTVELVLSKHIKLYLGSCKIVQTLAGRLCLVNPVYGHGYYGAFAREDSDKQRFGTFYPNRECRQEHIDLLDRVEEEGLKAVADIGLLTGICGICGRTLTAEESIAGGIGPICAGKVGFALASADVEL